MAAVYRAEDWVRGCLVAVKIMKAHQLGDPVAIGRCAPCLDAMSGLQRGLCPQRAAKLPVVVSGVRQVVAQARRY